MPLQIGFASVRPIFEICEASSRCVEALKHLFKLSILQVQLLRQLASQLLDFFIKTDRLVKEGFQGRRGLRTLILMCGHGARRIHIGAGFPGACRPLRPRYAWRLLRVAFSRTNACTSALDRPVKSANLDDLLSSATKRSADEANATFPAGYSPPYTPGTKVTEFVTDGNQTFIRVVSGNQPAGQW